MRLLVRPLDGLLSAAAGGGVAASAEAPELLWLAGALLDDEVVLLSAFDGSLSPAEEWLGTLEAALPAGVSLLGAFVRGGAGGGAPALPSQVPAGWRRRLRLLAARGEDDGLLRAWWDGSAVECGLDEPSRWQSACVRGRLLLSTAGGAAAGARRLGELGEGLRAAVRFRFPGSAALHTVDELRCVNQAVAFKGPSEPTCVELLAEGLGAGGPTNVAELDAAEPTPFRLDFAAYVSPGAGAVAAAEALLSEARRQLRACAAQKASGPPGVAFGCFRPEALAHVVCLRQTADAQHRAKLHRLLRLPNAPLLLPSCALPWGGEPHPRATGKPVNPHLDCGARPGWWKGGEETRSVFVRGLYEYNHYMHDKFNDDGWGCAYRSLQTCVSWYRMQFYSEKDVPGIEDIQRLLKRIDEAHKDLQVGSKKWIGTIEGMYLLQDYLGVDCRMVHCQDASDMATQVPNLLQHLEAQGSPIMMGVGNYAYTLVGICYDAGSGEVAFMIVDPHFTGADEMKTILGKGWVGWKKMDFFEKSAAGGFINCCLPLVPRDAGII